MDTLDSVYIEPLRQEKKILDARIREMLSAMELDQCDAVFTPDLPIAVDAAQSIPENPHSSTFIEFKVPVMPDWMLSPFTPLSNRSVRSLRDRSSSHSTIRSNSSFVSLQDSEDETRRIIEDSEPVKQSADYDSDSDPSYVPSKKSSMGPKKPRFSSEAAAVQEKNEIDLLRELSDDCEIVVNDADPVFINESKANRWKSFLATGYWEKLSDDPIGSDQDEFLTDVSSMSNDLDDSSSSDSDSDLQSDSASSDSRPPSPVASQEKRADSPTLSGLTPRLDFLNDVAPPLQEVIPNDRRAYFDLDDTGKLIILLQ